MMMLRSDFSYELPEERIAQEPRPRGRSRMLVVEPGEGVPHLEDRSFADFPSLLDTRDILVLNDTKVFPARLHARPLGNMKNRIEVLLVRRVGPLRWEAWCRPARRVSEGSRLEFSESLSATVVGKESDGITVLFDLPGENTGASEARFWEEIERVGEPPLPPYIHRDEVSESDRDAYQTVYAAKRGAIAAPTAGLHFTERILHDIESKGIEIVRLTLHVGLGTFKPVKVDRIADHVMESEQYEISPQAAASLNRALDERRRIVAVGTTSVRALEAAIRAGEGSFPAGRAQTSIFITPGFEFKAVDRLLTNFHLPESTLLMLVSAFAGLETIRTAYRHAIEAGYFFYSFGDCMLLERRAASDER